MTEQPQAASAAAAPEAPKPAQPNAAPADAQQPAQAEAAPDKPAAPPEPPRTFSQEELNEIVEKRLSKERRKREDIERRLRVTEELALKASDRARAEPQKPVPQHQQGQNNGDDPEPSRDTFQDYEQYLRSLGQWEGRQAARKVLSEREAKDRESQAQTEQQKAGKEFRERMKESAKGLEDFEDVLADATASPDAPVSRLSAEPIAHADNPAKILYHLAQNPEEAERIASLPLGKQAREIWKLDAQFGSAAGASATPPAARTPSKAPEPITPVGAKSSPALGTMPDPATKPEEWMKWRKAQLASKIKRASA
jgi:hypothetical protein